MELGTVGEFGLIDHIKAQFSAPEGITGIGDDCAVLPQNDGLDTIVSTDMLVEGIHFLTDKSPATDIGWKAAAVNLSDIAAMGGRPSGSFLSLALPKSLSLEWVHEFIGGFRQLSDIFNCPLLGGDTTSSTDGICINVTVLGTVPSGTARTRSAAIPGDLICVTGSLGDSSIGLKMLLGSDTESADYGYFVNKHTRPMPRVREGMELAQHPGIHAMMDISDGLGSDIRHILKASGVGAVVDVRTLPLSDQLIRYCRTKGIDPCEPALCGGEDYELLFTVSEDYEALIGIAHSVIGKITKPEEGLVWKGSDKDFLGFRHF